MCATAVVVVVMPLVAGCGVAEYETRDFCTQYGEFVASVDALRQLDPSTASAGQVRSLVQDVQENLYQVTATADGRLNSQITNLRASLLGLQEAAVTASEQGFVAARPMLHESLTEVKQSLAALQEAADRNARLPELGSAPSNGGVTWMH